MSLKTMMKRALGQKRCERLRGFQRRLKKLHSSFLGPDRPATRPSTAIPVSLAEIRSALEQLEIRKGDIVLIHSSVSDLGKAGSQPDPETPRNPVLYAFAIIELLLDVVGPTGTVLMPTEGNGDPTEREQNDTVFDWRTTPSNRGLITELFRRRNDVIRSVHPWYNITGWGRLAEELIKDHARSTPYTMDRHSPWFKLTEMGGKVLFLGTTLDSNSLLHLPEYLNPEAFPRRIYYENPIRLSYRERDGSIQKMDVMIHVPDWRSGEGMRFADYLNDKYQIYARANMGSSQAISYIASRQLEALYSELRQGVTWYDVRNWQSDHH